MIEFETVFVILLIAMAISNVISIFTGDYFGGTFHLAISVVFLSGIGVLALILWLIEHVRFV